jgi:DNA-binding PadR family transcriptional regulator
VKEFAVNPISLAVLSLLDERQMHPYEMAFTMRERHLSEHVKLNFGSLYHAVENLQRLGWIQPAETSREGRRPERTVYAITEPGRAAMRRGLEALLAEPVKEYTRLEAGLSFLHHLPAQEAVALLEERAVRLEAWLGQARDLRRVLEAKGLTRLSIIEGEFVISQRENELAWLRNVATEIRAGKVEWAAGFKKVKEEVKG